MQHHSRPHPSNKALISFHHSTLLPRLIVTDLDGTLLTPQHTISHRSIQALSLAQHYHPYGTCSDPSSLSSIVGHNHDNKTDAVNNNQSETEHPSTIRVMIASGRSPRSIQKVIDLFQGMMIPDAVICCNGALNYNPRTKTISYPQFIPLDQALFMVQHLRSTITAHGTRKSEIPLSKNPNEVGILGTDLQPLLQLTHDQSQEASQDQKNQKNDQEKTIDKNDPWIAGRVGFACEVIWYLGETGSGEPIYAQDTTFVCDKTWELQRKHSIYYEYTVVDDTMEVFINSLQPPPSATSDSVKQRMRPANKQLGRGGIVKLMALDRNRTAPQVYESLPDYLRPSTTATTATTTSPAELTPRVAVTYSGAYFLEISAAGVNKGLGLSKYCEAEGLAREDVVAFGDLLNDAEMLQFAGLGLCMGNGHEDMKRLADRIIGTNAEDGVAQEIESWFA